MKARSVQLRVSTLTVQQPRCPQCLRLQRPWTRAYTSCNRQRHPSDSLRRSQSTSAHAAAVARDIFNGGHTTDPALAGLKVDPLKAMAKELGFLSHNIKQLLGSGHPMLDTVAKYYTKSTGKHIRPLLVLLMSRATALTPKAHSSTRPPLDPAQINASISPASVLVDTNPSQPTFDLLSSPSLVDGASSLDILPSQTRLAEITELIHTASLLHDDVIDHATTRRSNPSANVEFGNKMAVLAGDFLLGRASVALARLRNAEVIELLATVIANLVEGEFMQLQNLPQAENASASTMRCTDAALTYYLQKTYLKSASLISKSCRAAALLGGCQHHIVDAAYSYGRNLGLAFQLVDDMLDYTIDGAELGKPSGADLELGLATAPLLFAWKDDEVLGQLLARRFSQEGDVQQAREIVLQSNGLEQTRVLAQDYADKAVQAISEFPDSEAKLGLVEMCEKTMKRRK